MPRDNETAIDNVYDDILNRARTHRLLRGVSVLDGPADNGDNIPRDDDGHVKPYVVIKFGGRGEVNQGQRGIVGARGDLQRLYWGAEVYARTQAAKRRIADDVLDIFLGYEPVDSGEITSPYSGAIENPTELVRNEVREGIGLVFTCMTNRTVPSDVVSGGIA